MAWAGMAWPGMERSGSAGRVRFGTVWMGPERFGRIKLKGGGDLKKSMEDTRNHGNLKNHRREDDDE